MSAVISLGATTVDFSNLIEGMSVSYENQRCVPETIRIACASSLRSYVQREKAHALIGANFPEDSSEARYHKLQTRNLSDAAQYLREPAHFWTRGRALSRLGNVEEAISVFQAAVERFPQDAYSHHYLAWNLDTRGESPAEIERHYREAIRLEPNNPWYNSRLITFLADRARHRAAFEAWTTADETIPPIHQSQIQWRIQHMDRWVAHAWLDAAQPFRLQEMVERLPALKGHEEVGPHIAHAIEEATLETAVHPPGTPADQRWSPPEALPKLLDGAKRTAWYPGVIRSIDDEGVEIVFADPDLRASERISRLRRLSIAECAGAGWSPRSPSGTPKEGYVAIGVYGDRLLIVDLPFIELPTLPDRLDPDRFRRRRSVA